MKYKCIKWSVIALTIFSAVFSFPILYKNYRVSKIIRQLTLEERYYLDAFLRRFFFIDHFLYVLFGNKPVAFEALENSIPFNLSYDCVSKSRIKKWKGLEVFRKLFPLFSSRSVIVQINDYPAGIEILILNKKNIINVFQKCRDDFEQVLGKGITLEKFMAEIERGEFWDAIKCHEALLGILLGYGRNNSWLYYKMRLLSAKLEEFPLSLEKQESLQIEFTRLKEQLGSFCSERVFPISFTQRNYFSLPRFRAELNSLETRELREQYENDREKIKRILDKHSLTEAVFRALY